jgi:hypothetical protein
MITALKRIACAALLAATADAFAQDVSFCSSLAGVVSEAATGFKKFRGAKDEYAPELYAANYKLGNSSSCNVFDSGTGDTMYTCYWELRFSQDSVLQAKKLIEIVRGCYPKAKTLDKGEYYYFYLGKRPDEEKLSVSIKAARGSSNQVSLSVESNR